jgi:hypothetical protein
MRFWSFYPYTARKPTKENIKFEQIHDIQIFRTIEKKLTATTITGTITTIREQNKLEDKRPHIH